MTQDFISATAKSDVANFATRFRERIAFLALERGWDLADQAVVMTVCCEAYEAGMDSVVALVKEQGRAL